MHLYLQGSGNLRMSGCQTDRNTAQILVFLDDLFMLYQAVGVMCFVLQECASLYALIRTYGT